jgi:hypothetical protein
MLLLVVYVPQNEVEGVKQALFAAGAGTIGAYSHCSWQVLGQGQFLPLPGAKPSVGAVGRVAEVAEYRVEMICPLAQKAKVLAALKQAHPYETPAYHFIELVQDGA